MATKVWGFTCRFCGERFDYAQDETRIIALLRATEHVKAVHRG